MDYITQAMHPANLPAAVVLIRLAAVFVLMGLIGVERRYIVKRALRTLPVFVQDGELKSEDLERLLRELVIRLSSRSLDRNHDKGTYRFRYLICFPAGNRLRPTARQFDRYQRGLPAGPGRQVSV